LRALALAVDEADELLFALRRGTDDDQQALRGVLEAGLHVDAVDPEIDVALGREIALAPARVLVRPGVLEPPDGRGREPAGVLAEQREERLLEVAGGDALEVEDRDQHFEALRPTRVGRQNRRRKADPLATFAAAVAHARAAHSDRTDAGHDLTLGQMPVAHQPLAAIIGELVGMATEQARNLGLDSLRQQRSRAVAQNLGQRIGKSSWLGELENVSVGHGVSLLRWRSGGVEHPHDTPPHPFMPSPTFLHSSLDNDGERFGRSIGHWSILFSKSSRWSNRLCQKPAIWLVQSISGAKAPSCALVAPLFFICKSLRQFEPTAN